MHQLDWDDLRYFLAVNETGSIAKAAVKLGVNRSTVLRRLDSLEETVGARLFERFASGYVLTGAGIELQEELRPIGEHIDAATRRVYGKDNKLSGTIRVTSTDTLSHALLLPCLQEFRQLHPDVHFEISLSNHFFSLDKREADLALRPSNLPPEQLIGRCVGHIRTGIYASEAYITRAGGREACLAMRWDEHDWIGLDDSLMHLRQAAWLKENVPDKQIVARMDGLTGVRDAVGAGLGVGLVLGLLAEQNGNLVALHDDLETLHTDVWVLTHPDLRKVARVRALATFLYDRLCGHKHLFPSTGKPAPQPV